MSTQHPLGGLLCGFLALTAAAHGAGPGEVIFQEDFHDRLAEGWSWEREDRATWRVGPAGLEVRVQPGNMWGGANNARNVLVRPVPVPTEAPVEISVVFSNAPTAQWEQANLVWFYDDSNMVKLGQELVTGRLSIVMGREENDRARTVAIVPLDDNTVELRLQAVKNRVRGQFRTRHWTEWREVGECDLPVKGEPKASLHFYNGPPNEEHWIKANRFTVRRLPAESVNWPRVRAVENIHRIVGSGAAAGDTATLSLGQGRFVLASDASGPADGGKADCEQHIFRHEDGSYGWSWDRRSSAGAEPVLLGVGLGGFSPHFRKDYWLPPGFVEFAGDMKSFELEPDAVTELGNDQGDHTLAAQVWLTDTLDSWRLTDRIDILFDWYGRAATGQSLNDGHRDYEFMETKPASPGQFRRFQYRISGFRGAPPRVNLRAFLADALRRGLPARDHVRGVWFGNEVWNGSRGGTLVTKFDVLLDGQRYSSVPLAAP
jgi:hypothetical protein